MRTITLLGLAFLVLVPSTGNALSIQSAGVPIFTGDAVDPAQGTLEFLGVADTLPSGSTSIAGSSGPSDPAILMRASLSSGILSSIDFFARSGVDGPYRKITGIGALPSSGGPPDGAVLEPEYHASVLLASLTPGGPAVDFYVSFEMLAEGDHLFILSLGPDPSATEFGFAVSVVPEPAAGALVAIGVLFVAAARTVRGA